MIQVQAKELYKAVKAVKLTTVNRLPVLNHCLLFLTDHGMMVMTAQLTTDGCKGNFETCPYWGNGERWQTCVPMVKHYFPYVPGKDTSKRKAYPFLDYLKIMTDYRETLQLEFEQETQYLTIKAGNSTSVFKCLDAQEFPRVELKEG